MVLVRRFDDAEGPKKKSLSFAARQSEFETCDSCFTDLPSHPCLLYLTKVPRQANLPIPRMFGVFVKATRNAHGPHPQGSEKSTAPQRRLKGRYRVHTT